MHWLAAAALAMLAGCLGEKTQRCNNGATCAFDEACTEVAVESGAPLCGTPRLVEACAGREAFTACPFDPTNLVDGVCLGNLCSECDDAILGCVFDGWKIVASPTEKTINGIWVAGPAEAYAVADERTFLHYDGVRWAASTVEIEGVANLKAIAGIDRENIYAVATSGHVLHRANGTWSSPMNAGTILSAIAVSAPDNIWVVGLGGTVLHYDGTAWQPRPIPGVTGLLNGVWTTGKDHAVVVGNAGVIARYQGGTWTVDAAQGSGPSLAAVWGRAANDVFAAGSPAAPNVPNLLHWNGTEWTPVFSAPPPSRVSLLAIAGTASGDVFLSGESGRVIVHDGSAWTEAMVQAPVLLRGIGASSREHVFAVGDGGLIVRSVGR